MKKLNMIRKILTKSLAGFTLGITLLMFAYISVYFIENEVTFQNELNQLQNINTFISQLLLSGLAYYIIFLAYNLYLILIEKNCEKKYIEKNPYLVILTVTIAICIYILLIGKLITNKHIFSNNIQDLNVVILTITFITQGLFLMIKEAMLVKQINIKLKEKNNN